MYMWGSLAQIRLSGGAIDYYLAPFNKEAFMACFIGLYQIPIEEFNKFVKLIQILQKLIDTKEDSKFPLEKKSLMIWINSKNYLLPNELWMLIFNIEEKEHMKKISDIESLIENYKEGYFIKDSSIEEIKKNLDKLI